MSQTNLNGWHHQCDAGEGFWTDSESLFLAHLEDCEPRVGFVSVAWEHFEDGTTHKLELMRSVSPHTRKLEG